MSDTSESLTPSQENLANMNDVRTYEAIDNLMQKDEQTYDEFLNGFTYLNKDDIVKDAQKKQLKKLINTTKNSKEKKTEAYTTSEIQSKNVSQDPDYIDIEEEVLEEGTKSSRMSNSSEVVTNTSVKFDNFVDAEELSGDDDDVGGYVSSFGNTEVPTIATTEDLDNLMNKDCEVKIDSKDMEEQNSPQDLINPGEVEDVKDPPSVNELQIDRCLGFSAKLQSDSIVENIQTSEETEILTDEVKPFSLDENFDYDNVILTPKFTSQELTYLNSFIPQKTELT